MRTLRRIICCTALLAKVFNSLSIAKIKRLLLMVNVEISYVKGRREKKREREKKAQLLAISHVCLEKKVNPRLIETKIGTSRNFYSKRDRRKQCGLWIQLPIWKKKKKKDKDIPVHSVVLVTQPGKPMQGDSWETERRSHGIIEQLVQNSPTKLSGRDLAASTLLLVISRWKINEKKNNRNRSNGDPFPTWRIVYRLARVTMLFVYIHIHIQGVA